MDIDKIEENLILAGKIANFILGLSTEPEREEVINWMKRSEDNESLLERIFKDIESRKYETLSSEIDVNQAWRNFKQKRLKRNSNLRNNFIRYTAIVAVSLGIGAFFYNREYFDDNNKNHDDEIALILPGSDKALLYTQKGDVISLDENSNMVVDTSSNVVVKESTISYLNSKINLNNGANTDNQFDMLVVPKGGRFHLLLVDSSEVWLNSGSKITYYTSMKESHRRVKVEGEAYFKVKRNEKVPFIVELFGNEIKVLGTEFTVLSYNDNEDVCITLVNGRVEVNSGGEAIKERAELNSPGMQSVISRNGTTKMKLHQVSVREFTAWKDNYFYYNNATFADVMKSLSRWYNFNYEILDEPLNDYRFSGEFARYESIEKILEIIKLTAIPITISCQNNTVLIKKDISTIIVQENKD